MRRQRCRKNYRYAVSKLQDIAHDNEIAVGDYRRTIKIFDSNRIGWRLGYYNAEATRQKNAAVDFDLSFEVPFHPRYGLFDVLFLHDMAPPGFDFGVFRNLLSSCIEIRGVPKAQGLFLPVSFFQSIVSGLQLDVDSDGLLPADPRDDTLDRFTHSEWLLLSSNESSELTPVHRATNMAHVCGVDGRIKQIPLGQFLQDRFEPDSQLGLQTEFGLERLVTPNPLQGSSVDAASLTPTAISSSDPLRFRFQKKEPAASEQPRTTSLARTSAWLDEQSTAKRQMRGTR